MFMLACVGIFLEFRKLYGVQLSVIPIYGSMHQSQSYIYGCQHDQVSVIVLN